MRKQELKAEYHLTCDGCYSLFWSKDGFPEPQLCQVCISTGKQLSPNKEETMADQKLREKIGKKVFKILDANEGNYQIMTKKALDIADQILALVKEAGWRKVEVKE